MAYPPKIKPSHVGLLHKSLGIPEGDKIGKKRLLSAKAGSGSKEKKQIQFALNFNK